MENVLIDIIILQISAKHLPHNIMNDSNKVICLWFQNLTFIVCKLKIEFQNIFFL